MKRPAKTSSYAVSKLRIIGGQWRGRKLPILTAEGLRPTGDRLRETLFNWLAPDVFGARCLDLYAGSGALGLEALSRGAACATLVELHGPAVRQLRENCTTLGTDKAEIIETDAMAWLQREGHRQFDVVFLDPPFAANLWQQSIDALEQQKFLADGALIYIEAPRGQVLAIPPGWQMYRSKTTGAVNAQLFIHTPSREDN